MRTLLASLALAGSLLAQAPPALNGAFFFEEEGALSSTGQRFRAIALLSFDGRGAVSGTESVKEASLTAARPVRGTYELDATGAGSLTLTYSTADDEGTLQNQTATYRMLQSAAGAYSLLRLDSGVLAAADLTPTPTTAAALAGSFLIKEDSPTAVSLATWMFDGKGNVETRTLSRGFFQST